jgi:flavin-dependent dehydrogenase
MIALRGAGVKRAARLVDRLCVLYNLWQRTATGIYEGRRMGLDLRNGDRVCIVGGGPAGCFAALHLLRLAAARGLRLEVLIFEPHDLAGQAGPRGCKGCAGILSAELVRNMAALGLTLPSGVIQSELRAYVIHLYGQATTVSQPHADRRILSVYRGSGPRLHAGEPLAGFDGYLLAQACERGARVIPARVRRVEEGPRPVVCTDGERYVADLLVLATGVNSRAPLDSAFGYMPPGTVCMMQDEIRRPPDWPEDKVAGFFGQPRGLVFGALVPKGPYLNVSLLWRNPNEDAIAQFYQAQEAALRRFFPAGPESLCGCSPRIAVKPARTYYGERWVAVGDAVVSRLYKDGINSAYLTTEAAMTAALERGIDEVGFAAGYAPTVRQIAADNVYGKWLYNLCALAMRYAPMARAYMHSVRNESSLAPAQRMQSRLLWGLLTGEESYRALSRLALQPRSLLALARGFMQPSR